MVKYNTSIQEKFRALSEPVRFSLLERLLEEGELSLTALFRPLEEDMSMPGALKHVRVLENAGLITSKKVGRERRYTPNVAGISEFRVWLEKSALFWNPALDRLKAHVEQN